MDSIEFLYSPWLLIPAAIVALILSWWAYAGKQEELPGWLKNSFIFTRTAVFLLIMLLLLEPIIESLTKERELPVIPILQDNTESIRVNRDSVFLMNEYPGMLKEFINKVDEEDTEPVFYTFSDELQSGQSPDSLDFSATGTDIGNAIEAVRELYAHRHLGAMVLLTDGISTAGMNPLYQLEGLNVPIFPVLLGDTTLQKDIMISGLLYNEIAYLKQETPIRVRIRNQGFASANLQVSITRGGKVLETQKINLSEGSSDGEVIFFVKPEETGVLQYGIHVTELEGEISTRNNHQFLFLNVLENRVKIALFAAAPHPDIGALNQAFERDDRYELVQFIRKTQREWYEDPAKYNLDEFDLIILHNFPSHPYDEAMISKITAQVKDKKTPLMAFMGIHTDHNVLKPLNEYLGITAEQLVNGYEEAQVHFKEEYRTHATYTFDEGWMNLMNTAPPLFRPRSTFKPKGDTKVFGNAMIRNVVVDYPVYGMQSHLGRKNMVWIGENFWRIRTHSYLKTDEFDAFDNWLFNNIQWLIVQEDKRRFKVRPVKMLFTGQEPVLFRGEAYDESYNPVSGADIKLTLTDPAGKETDYYLTESGDAGYYLQLSNLVEGTYKYKATGSKGEVALGTDRGEFSVGRSNIEHLRLQADKGMLEQIALRTGGKLYYARELPGLADELLSLETMKPLIDYRKSRKGLHEKGWWIFILILLLLTWEWAGRKIHGLP